ncbi:MAG: DUF4992 family lipoprotein [Prevotella sp.]
MSKRKTNVPTGLLSLAIGGVMMLDSCADGYDSPNGFDVGVSNQTLVTPGSLTFKVNTDGTEATISWPLVLGAKGYEVTMKNIDDPEAPTVVDGYDRKLVDGCSMTASIAEDSRYSFEFRVIGDNERDNRDGEKIDTVFSTLVPSVATIPAGSDIYQYLLDNPIDSVGGEVAIDLEPGGHYTMTGDVDFCHFNMTLRGNKVHPAFIDMQGGAKFLTHSGLKMKFLRIDMTNSTADGLLKMSENNLPDSIKSDNLEYMRNGSLIKNIYIIQDPVYLSDVWVKNLPNALVHDGSTYECAWWNLTINDCIIQMKNEGSTSFISFESKGRLIKNIYIKNSTIYNVVDNSKAYFLRFNNQSNSNPQKVFGNTTSEMGSWYFTMSNVTLSKAMSGQKWANNVNGTGFYCRFDHSIFYDLFQPFRRIAEKGGNFTMKFNFFYNPKDEGDTDYTRKDTSGAPFASLYNPLFPAESLTRELDLEAENGGVDFTPGEKEIVYNNGGDTRWLR